MASILHQLTPYMFNDHTLATFNSPAKNATPAPKCVNNQSKKEVPDVFIPKYKDTLFWCFYIKYVIHFWFKG